jgi:hypothetical protein
MLNTCLSPDGREGAPYAFIPQSPVSVSFRLRLVYVDLRNLIAMRPV